MVYTEPTCLVGVSCLKFSSYLSNKFLFLSLPDTDTLLSFSIMAQKASSRLNMDYLSTGRFSSKAKQASFSVQVLVYLRSRRRQLIIDLTQVPCLVQYFKVNLVFGVIGPIFDLDSVYCTI